MKIWELLKGLKIPLVRRSQGETMLPAIDPRSTVDLIKELWDVHTSPKKQAPPPAIVNTDIYSVPPRQDDSHPS